MVAFNGVDMVHLARKNLLHDKLRFAITIAGVSFAVTLVLVQVGLFLGLLDNASITIDRLDADLWVTSHNTPNVDFAHTFPDTRVQRVRSVPGVEKADNLIIWFMQMSLPSGATEGTLVYAMENLDQWGLPWSHTGAPIRDLRRGKNMMLDDSALKRYGPFAVGDYRELLDHRLQIIGQTHGARSFTTTPVSFMEFGQAQSMDSQLDGETTYIVLRCTPGADVNAVARQIRKRLPYNDVYTREQWRNRSRDYWTVNTGIGLNAYLTVALGCVIGIVVVGQTLYTATMEHLKEFGTVKAIGGSNSDIYKILIEQALISAIIGFVLGVIPTFFIGPLVEMGDLKLIIPPVMFLYVFLGTVAMCLGASLISFRKVASIDPAMVFRT
jgi:putative ABC transport system permease protein